MHLTRIRIAFVAALVALPAGAALAPAAVEYTVLSLGNHVVAGLNDRGDAVGYFLNNDPHANHAFVFQGGTFTDLGRFGGEASYATAVNNAGQVVVQVPDDVEGRTLIW